MNMKDKIKIGIVGYGNLGRGVEQGIAQNPDLELEAIFTRREAAQLDTLSKVEHISRLEAYKGIIDVMILCGGSATDLDSQGPMVAQLFNTVDSFDTHAKVPEYFAKIDAAARKGGNLSIISTGWDPGLFSLNRLLGLAVLPQGEEYTFWGKGVSQGHSDAVRRVEGVKDGVQYTVPFEEALHKVRTEEYPRLTTREKHERVCYIVPEEGADLARLEQEIVNMPHYFADYDTTVHFVSAEDLRRDHSGMPHGGVVIRMGTTGEKTTQRMEFGLQLESNPEFTASVLIAYARAIYRMSREGRSGACTVFDVPLGYLSPWSPEKLRAELL